MNEIFTLFLSLSISGTIIALILFLLKPITKDRFSKTWQYYIWFIVVIRLLLPFSPGAGIVGGLFNQADNYISVQGQANSTNDLVPDDTENTNSQHSTLLENESAKRSTGTETAQSLKDNIWIFWLVIAAILFVRKVMCYHSFVDYIKAGRKKITDPEMLTVYQEISKLAGVKKPLPLYQNELISTPMLVGVIRPFVVLPDLNVSRNETSHIFQHELTHYKQLDIFYKWLVQIAVCLHWFNPIVYLMRRETNKNCELACDEAIIKRMDEKEKYDYGDTLLATINPDSEHNNAVISITLNEDARLLKERLGAIMNFRKKSGFISILTLIITMGIFCGVTFVGAYIGSDSSNSDNAASEFSIYQSYGLTYNTKTDKLYYDGQIVRYFADDFSNGHGNNFCYKDPDGTIDLYAVRENDGENVILTGIETYSQKDYDLRTVQMKAEQSMEPDYGEAYKILIEEVPESLLLWINQCQTSANDGISFTAQNGRYYVYCRTKGEYDFELTSHGDLAELTIDDVGDGQTGTALIARYSGYALISVPYCDGLSIVYNSNSLITQTSTK